MTKLNILPTQTVRKPMQAQQHPKKTANIIMKDAIWTFVVVLKGLQICELMLSLQTWQHITMQEIEWYFQGMLGIKRNYLNENLNWVSRSTTCYGYNVRIELVNI